MERINSALASALIGIAVLAGFGIGIIALGFAIILGGVITVALRLAGPRIVATAERRAAAADMHHEGIMVHPASA